MPINRGYTCDRCGYQDPDDPALETYPEELVYCFDCTKDVIEVLKAFNQTDAVNKD